jgi:HEAT repeat protein
MTRILLAVALSLSAVAALPQSPRVPGEAEIPGLLRTLQTSDANARKSSAQQLAMAAPTKAVCDGLPVIADHLSDSDSGVRTWIAGVLMECVIGDPSLAPRVAQQRAALLDGLSASDPTERGMMLRLVASLPDTPPELRGHLIELLHDPDRKTRRIAIGAVQRLKPLPPEAVAALDSLLERNDEDRGAAAETLGAMKVSDSRTIMLLESALQDKDRYVRQEAVRALAQIGHPAVLALTALRALADDPKTDDLLKKQAGDAIQAIQ